MDIFASDTDLAHIIQLALAPVFLLAGIAAFLGVMSSRLSRAIDRSRSLNRQIRDNEDPDRLDVRRNELAMHKHRIKLINVSIILCTATALMIAVVVASLFIGGILDLAIGYFVATLFVLAMFLLVLALINFLREVRVATLALESTQELIE